MEEIEKLQFSEIEEEILKTIDAFLIINHRAHIQHSINGLSIIIESMNTEMAFTSDVVKDVGSVIYGDLDSFNEMMKEEFSKLIPLSFDETNNPVITPNLLRIFLLSVGISKGNMGVWVSLMREILGDIYGIEEPKLNYNILQLLKFLDESNYIIIFSDKPMEELEKLSTKKEDALKAVSMMHISLTNESLEYIESLLDVIGIEETKKQEYNLAEMEPVSTSLN